MKSLMKSLFIKLQPLLFRLARRGGKAPLVYLESFHGKHCNDSPRAIYNELSQRGISCVFGANKHYIDRFEKEGVPYVVRFSKQWYQAVACAAVWVTNTRTKTWIEKSPWTYYLNTWHGTPLKKLGLDIDDVNISGQTTEEYHDSVKEECALWNQLIVPSDYAATCFQSAFHLKEDQCLPIGYPRNDQLVQTTNEKKERLKRQFGLNNDDQIILYAPTWRDDLMKDGAYTFEFPFDAEALLQMLPDNVHLFIRMHYLVSESFSFPSNRIHDVSNYEEMGELLQISDCLITDYSSCFFDYALLQRPIIFYMFDKEDYIQQLRGAYINVDTLPFPIITKEEELIQQLKVIFSSSDAVPQQSYDAFQQKYNQYEQGNAAKQAADVIIKKIEEI